MSLLGAIIWCIVLTVTAVVAPVVYRASVRKRLRSAPSKVEHGALVTVIGRIVETDELVEAPLTGRRGVLVVASAELPEFGPDGPLIYRSFAMKPFDLDTVTAGIVRIDATMADIGIAGRGTSDWSSLPVPRSPGPLARGHAHREGRHREWLHARDVGGPLRRSRQAQGRNPRRKASRACYRLGYIGAKVSEPLVKFRGRCRD